MEPEVQIRRFRHEDIPKLNEIMKKVHGISADESSWIWKYEDNPAKKNYSHVAVAGDRIVAHCGAIPTEVQIGGERVAGVQLADILSDKEHRVKGAFTLAYFTAANFAEEAGARIVLGFANPTGFGYATQRSAVVKSGLIVPRCDRIVNLAPFVKRFMKYSSISSVIAVPGNVLIRLLHSIGNPREVDLGKIEEVAAFDARFDELWEEIGNELPRTTVRSSSHLGWRYMRHPLRRYMSYAFVDRGKPRGFIVLRVLEEEGIRRGLIVDLIAGYKRPTVWNSLLVKAIDYFRREEVDLMTCWMFSHMPYFRSLEKLHFVDRPSNLSVLVRDFAGEYDQEYLNDERNGYVSMGESDIF